MGRSILVIALLVVSSCLWAQVIRPEPFSEARKAVTDLNNAPKIVDSLKRVYNKRWNIGLVYGQRFVASGNLSDEPDTITFTDFTNKRSFFGVEGGYFVTQRLQVSLAFNILFLPKEQEINTVTIGGPNGIQVEGSGSGGAMINIGVGGRYFFSFFPFTRPYVGLKIGRIKAVAEGGNGGFNPGQGRYQETTRLSRNYNYGNINLGLGHRFTPGFMFDYNLGYLYTNKEDNIGGILSPGGLTTSLTLQFLIGIGNKAR